MFADDYFHSGGLVLGLGLSSSSSNQQPKRPSSSSQKPNEPSLTLSLSGSEIFDQARKADFESISNPAGLYGAQQDYSAGSSSLSVKRERDCCEEERVNSLSSSRASDDDDDGSNGRKKLRLTKAQSALLEDSFTHHSTLNPKQKQELARELKLRPRQVEVWFQNRRARTKLKQTEVDCEFLKKCCETLTDENRRLQKELQALKLAKPLYMQLPAAATLNICPSCDRLAAAAGGGGGPDNNNNVNAAVPAKAAAAAATFNKIMPPNHHHLYNPFITNHPSAAC